MLFLLFLSLITSSFYAQSGGGTVDSAGPLNTDPLSGLEAEVPSRDDELPCYGYTEPGSTINVFDWRAEFIDVYIQPTNGPAYTRNIRSPYYSSNTNVIEFGFLLDGDTRDFEPADGWELLYYNLGNSIHAVPEPSFALYNRFDGRVVSFWFIEPDDGSAPESVLLNFEQFTSNSQPVATGFFNDLNIPSNTIDDIVSNFPYGFSQLNKGFAGANWYYVEGIMSYDPCVCNAESALTVEPVLTDITQLRFDMNGDGVSEANYEEPDPSGGESFLGKAIRSADGLFGAIDGGYKRYKTMTDYQYELNLTSNSDSSGIVSTTGKFTKVLSQFLPGSVGWAGAAFKVLGFLAGKSKADAPLKLTGFDHQFSFEANGEIISEDPYTPYIFYSPGSTFDTNQIQFFRPIYDNPLGVFAVLEPPTVQTYTEVYLDTDGNQMIESFYRYAGDLKYRVNLTAGLSELPVSIAAALVWPEGCQQWRGSSSTIPISMIASPSTNLACLGDSPLAVRRRYEYSSNDPRGGYVGISCAGPPSIQLIVSFKEEGGENEAFFSAIYPTQLEEVDGASVDWGEYIAATQTPDPAPYCSGAVPVPVTDLELAQFCIDKYDPVLAIGAGTYETERTEVLDFDNESFELPQLGETQVFPNPVSDRLWLNVSNSLSGESIDMTLFDLTGRELTRVRRDIVSAGRQEIPMNWSQFERGVYLLRVTTHSGYSQNFRITKQ